MKKKILKSIACLLLMGMAWSCSNESDTIMSDSNENGTRDGFHEKSASVWNGPIAQETTSGQFTIVADMAALRAEFESKLLDQGGEPVKIETIIVQRKTATNNPNDRLVFLIGGGRAATTNKSVSSGIILSAASGGMYFSSGPGGGVGGDPKSVSCWGCATGCFLEYYDIDGHKVPYCNSAGCGPLCDKKED